MLASMSKIHPGVDVVPVDWSADGVSELVPTGTVTLLLADIEGATHLPGSQLDTTAIAKLDRTLTELVREHRGVCPVEQGEGDSFLVAFARASDAVACALGLQRAPLAPIRLRIGMHTGEVSSPDEGNCVGPTIDRTARLRELAHGGQTVLSGTTSDLVADLLPKDAWLNDLGTYRLDDLPRPERVVQLCHPDLHNAFPPLRTRKVVGAHCLPAQLTRLVGRVDEVAQVRGLLDVKRWVTLTGVGGVGKTRLATQVASAVADGYPDGVWYVNLAPITDPALVPIAAARVLGLPDQPGRSTVDTIVRRIGDRRMLVVLDNCEHLLDGCAALIVALLGACPALRVLATSREPIAVAGEQIWRVPPLGHGEAIELLARALTACGGVAAYNADLARPWLAEAVGLARAVGDKWRLAEVLAWQAYVGFAGEGDPGATRAAGEEARSLADEIGDAFLSRSCRWALAAANLWQGNLEAAVGLSREVIGESDAAHDMVSSCAGQACLAHALAHRGDTEAAAAAQASIDTAVGLSPVLSGSACSALVFATLAAGDVAAAEHARESATRFFGASAAAIINDPTSSAQISCARGDLNAAHRLADGAASITRGVHRARALTTRCRIEIAQGDRHRAERDAHDALGVAASIGAYLWVPDILECLASVMADAGSNREAVRLFGAADAARGRMGAVRFGIYQAGCNSSLATLRKSMGDSEFDDAWAEGTALSIDEAIAYAQRGRGARKRPTSGWGALTPTELEVALLVGEGLSNKEIGVRLFISPRTVHSHLTHVYTKLGLSSRLQLAQQAARRGESERGPSRP